MFSLLVASVLLAQPEKGETATFEGLVVQVNRIEKMESLDEPSKIRRVSVVYIMPPNMQNADVKERRVHVLPVHDDVPVKKGALEEGSLADIKIGGNIRALVLDGKVTHITVMTPRSRPAEDKLPARKDKKEQR